MAQHADLLRQGLIDEVTGASPLHLAAANGDVATIEILLDAGFPPDASDGQGGSALMMARAHDQSDAEGVLIRAGAVDPEVKQWPAEVPIPELGKDAANTQTQGDGASNVSVCGTDTFQNPGDIGSVAGDYTDSAYCPSAEEDDTRSEGARDAGALKSPLPPVAQLPKVEEVQDVRDSGAGVPAQSVAASLAEKAEPGEPAAKEEVPTAKKPTSWASLSDARDDIDKWMDEWAGFAAKHSHR